jgi:hypothetical protein
MSQQESELWKGWRYEFEAWISRLQSVPVLLVKSVDHSESYEMDRRHIFKLENGSYAFVTENGCSCYSSSEAKITLCKDIGEAIRVWNGAIDARTWDTAWLGDRIQP